MRCPPKPILAARMANSILSCRRAPCWRARFRSSRARRSSATVLPLRICCRRKLRAQNAAGLLADLGNNALAERVDFGIGHGLVARLYRDSDSDRLLVRRDAGAFIDIEQADIDDELFVDAL